VGLELMPTCLCFPFNDRMTIILHTHTYSTRKHPKTSKKNSFETPKKSYDHPNKSKSKLIKINLTCLDLLFAICSKKNTTFILLLFMKNILIPKSIFLVIKMYLPNHFLFSLLIFNFQEPSLSF
jgi:hypothetical protein